MCQVVAGCLSCGYFRSISDGPEDERTDELAILAFEPDQVDQRLGEQGATQANLKALVKVFACTRQVLRAHLDGGERLRRLEY